MLNSEYRVKGSKSGHIDFCKDTKIVEKFNTAKSLIDGITFEREINGESKTIVISVLCKVKAEAEAK